MQKRVCSLALLALQLIPLMSQAQVYEFSFKNTNQEKVSVKPLSSTKLNPATTIDVKVISGLDRYIHFQALNKTGSVVYDTTSSLIKTSDRITASDSVEFYGKVVTVPALADGDYTFRTEILDINKSPVDTYNYPVKLITHPPTYTKFYPYSKYPYESVMSGDLWKLGQAGNGSSNIYIDGLQAEAGIKEARLNIRYGEGNGSNTGKLYSSTVMGYDSTKLSASFTYTQQYKKPAAMPSDDLEHVFVFEPVITDNAGNKLSITPQKFMFDDQIGEYELFAVGDSSSQTSVVPGVGKGYVAYKKGMKVSENPYRVVFRVPRSNYYEYRLGGITFINGYGYIKILSTTESDVYVELLVPQGDLDGNWIRINNFARFGGGDLLYLPTVFDFSETKIKSPLWRSPYIQRQDQNGNWVDTVSRTLIQSSDLPVTWKSIKYLVEPRDYEQKVTGAYPCTVPAGENSCTVAINDVVNKGTYGFGRNRYDLTSSISSTFRFPKYEFISWQADQNPSITSYSYNATSSILTININEPRDELNLSSIALNKVWLSDTKAGKSLITATRLSRNTTTGNYVYTVNMKSLPEGDYNIRINADDTFGNIATADYGKFVVDRTPPTVNMKYESKAIAKDTTVYGLENIIINIADATSSPRMTKLLLTGGPTDDTVSLSWKSNSDGSFSPEYPRLFASLEAGEEYTLTATASDEMNNAGSAQATFKYIPKNLIRLDNLQTLAVAQALKTSTGEPLALLVTNSLRKSDGALVTGIQKGVVAVRKDADFAISVNGTVIKPGDSANIDFNFGNSTGLSVPIYPAVSGESGSAEFYVEFPDL